MKVAITGASGLIGAALQRELATAGHEVTRLVRRAPREGELRWSPRHGELDAKQLVGTDVVVHLAGEPVMGLRWTAAKKRRVMQSRVLGTTLIAEALAGLNDGPRVLLSGSAVGFYGPGRDWVDEGSPRGSGFLAEVCDAWERASAPASAAGIRVVRLRTGLVLSAAGGALPQMLPAFRLGLGGVLGGGDQYFPWIAIDDVVAAIIWAMSQAALTGPVNLVAPNPVTNREFTETLGRTLHRPTIFGVPGFAIRAALGGMGVEMLLSGQRVRPSRLLDTGYEFQFSDLGAALTHILG